MLTIKDLKGLSYVEVENKVKPVSAKLVPMLVERGILKANKGVLFESNNMYNLNMKYTVEDTTLICDCEGGNCIEYVIGINDNGFNVISLDANSMCYGEIKVVSKEDEKVIYEGEFDFIEN